MNKKLNFIGIKYFPLSLIGVAAMLFIALRPEPRDGLRLLWLLPFTFSICILFFSKIIDYHKDGVGLKILYSIILIRYILSPVLIAITDGAVGNGWIGSSSEGYQFAVLVSVIELLICCLTISLCWRKYFPKFQAQAFNDRDVTKSLTIGGLFLILMGIVLVFVRGIEGVASTFGFLLLDNKYQADYVDSYSIVYVQVIKSFLFVCILVWANKNYKKTNLFLWPLIAGIATFLNISTYFGYNRSSIFETAVASIFTLYAAFPKLKRVFTILLVPVAAGVLFSLILIKQFGVNTQTVGQFDFLSLSGVSNTLEIYTNGMWPLATSYDAVSWLQNRISPFTPVKDTTDNFYLFKVPGFTVFNDWLSDIDTSTQLYQIYTLPGTVLPLSGQMMFYGGFVFGPLFALMANILAFYLLTFCELKSKLVNSLQGKFTYLWLASLLGLTMCYNWTIIWWSVSKFMFFLVIVFWINNHIVLGKKSL